MSKLALVTSASFDDSAPKPAIATLKENLAMGVLELNSHAAKGALNSFQATRDRVNKLVDQYIQMRTLTLA